MFKTYYFYSENNGCYLLTKAENKTDAKTKFINRMNDSYLTKERVLNYEIFELNKSEIVELYLE